MSNMEKFNKILQFAIEREEEAVQFYTELQGMVSFKSKIDLLQNLADMERGHIKILENIRNRASSTTIGVPQVDNLNISEYMLDIEPSPNMSYQDILIIAMKREEKANQFYSRLAEEADNGDVKNLFLKLASEEAGHKLHFEKIYDEEILTEN